MEAQGIAVAEAVGLPFSLRRVRVTGAMQFVPAPLQLLLPPARLLRSVASNEKLEAPWPRLDHLHRPAQRADRARHQAALPAARLRAAHPEPESAGPPVRPHRRAGPRRLRGAERRSPPSAPCTASPASRLAEAGKRFAPRVKRPPSPAHRRAARRREPSLQLPARDRRSLRRQARAPRQGERRGAARHAVAPHARRIPLRRSRAPSRTCRTSLWDGTGDNPYFAFLALADAIVVTEDSVNMVTEAAGTGKPVYVQELSGRSTGSPASTA